MKFYYTLYNSSNSYKIFWHVDMHKCYTSKQTYLLRTEKKVVGLAKYIAIKIYWKVCIMTPLKVTGH